MNSAFEPRSRYVRRVLDAELDDLLPHLAAISLDGPKGVGKTSTAVQRGSTMVALDQPQVLDIVRADPDRVVRGDEPIIIDEWQQFPSSWDLVRRAVDADPRPGRFILTGSASPSDPPTHSGAGRIVSVRMRPLTLAERGVEVPTVSLTALLSGSRPRITGSTTVTLEDYTREIVVGGFPGMRMEPGRAQRAALDGYLTRIVDRDFADAAGHRVRNPGALRRWMRAYAAATATTASFETIRDASMSGEQEKPARSTTAPYRDTLGQLWVVDPLPAWTPTRNHLARLTGAPKHHLADPALAARLVGVGFDALLDGDSAAPAIPRDGPFLGALFESLVALDVRVFAQAAEGRVHHLRTRGGEHEVDFIVERADRRVVALEVKLAQAVGDDDVRHLHWLADRLGPDLLDAVVVTTGQEAYRRADGIAVVPAALLGV